MNILKIWDEESQSFVHIAAIKGDTGATGQPGINGTPGEPGADGEPGKSPIIQGDPLTWWTWDIDTQAYVDTGVPASGSGGTSTSADKLTTARTLWGQSFDGTANVSGDILGAGKVSATSVSISGSVSGVLSAFSGASNVNIRIGRGAVTKRNTEVGYKEISSTDTDKNLASFGLMGQEDAERLWLTGEGRVGIGLTEPTEKLEVSGNIKADNFYGTVSYATDAGKLFTPRMLWGNQFDGTSDITGNLTSDGIVTANNFYIAGSENNLLSVVNDKVDKVSGMGLSSNDYTTIDKQKLGRITTIVRGASITGSSTNNSLIFPVLDTNTGIVNNTIVQLGLVGTNAGLMSPTMKAQYDAYAETIAQNSADIESLTETYVNSGFFKGYFSTQAELATIEDPKEGDFAWVAEIVPPSTTSNVWVYEGGVWVDSGVEVPTQSVQLSDSAPKVAGTPSAGIGSEASRWDHIHPSDPTKVSVVTGKGLSTNDYTTAEQTKLAGIADNANNYVHPTYTGRSSGMYKLTVDGTGHISAATSIAKSDIVALGIPAQDTTYSVATTTTNGLMSSSDKTKLGTIAENANFYEHPLYTSRAAGLYKVTVNTQGHVTNATAVAKSDITALGIPAQDTTYNVFSTTTAGLVPATSTSGSTRYLREDGTWQTIEVGPTYEPVDPNGDDPGLMTPDDKIRLDRIDGVQKVNTTNSSIMVFLSTIPPFTYYTEISENKSIVFSTLLGVGAYGTVHKIIIKNTSTSTVRIDPYSAQTTTPQGNYLYIPAGKFASVSCYLTDDGEQILAYETFSAASTYNDGLMSRDDKRKLDATESYSEYTKATNPQITFSAGNEHDTGILYFELQHDTSVSIMETTDMTTKYGATRHAIYHNGKSYDITVRCNASTFPQYIIGNQDEATVVKPGEYMEVSVIKVPAGYIIKYGIL